MVWMLCGLMGVIIGSILTTGIDYNFGRVHKTLRVTPAMEAGLTDHVWSLEGMVGLAA